MSVRLFLRRGQQLDLRLEKIPEGDCCLEINPDPGCDDNIIVSWSVKGRGEPGNAERKIYDAIYRPSTPECVGEGYGNVMGVGNQTSFGLNSLLAQQNALQTCDFDQSSLNANAAGVES